MIESRLLETGEAIRILSRRLGRPVVEKPSRGEFVFFCPADEHERPKAKLCVNLQKFVFHCWSCVPGSPFSGGFLDVLVRLVDPSSAHLFERPGRVPMLSSAAIDRHLVLPHEFCSLVRRTFDDTALVPLRYCLSRGVKPIQIVRRRLGFCSIGEFAGRVVVPSFDDGGALNHFVARTFVDHPRRYLLPDVPRNDVVFGELDADWSSPLFLVEGVFDMIALDNAVPLLGSTLSSRSRLLRTLSDRSTPTLVAVDVDGMTATHPTLGATSRTHVVRALAVVERLIAADVPSFLVPMSGKDPSSVGAAAMVAAAAGATRIRGRADLLRVRTEFMRVLS